MKKRILVLHYSQTGQLTNLLENMLSPLKDVKNVEVVMSKIESTEDFSFPWNFFKFFDAFPETVYLDGPQNKPLNIANMNFDLIIIGYQPWFLSPSMPISSFMKSNQAKIILKNKPVITVIGCRNMWIEAQRTMKELITQCGGILIDNVVLTDQSGPLESFITTPRWMLTGKKDSFLGLSPAGIKSEDITRSNRFGKRILEKLDTEIKNEPMLTNLSAVKADERFIASEKIAKRSFLIWGKLIRLFGQRGSLARIPILVVYILFLITLILTVVPINMLLQTLLRKLFKEKNDKILTEIENPSGR